MRAGFDDYMTGNGEMRMIKWKKADSQVEICLNGELQDSPKKEMKRKPFPSLASVLLSAGWRLS